jgi:hypothetical protein
MLWLSYQIEDSLNAENIPTGTLTAIFTLFTFLSATQDIAVDGISLVLPFSPYSLFFSFFVIFNARRVGFRNVSGGRQAHSCHVSSTLFFVLVKDKSILVGMSADQI